MDNQSAAQPAPQPSQPSPRPAGRPSAWSLRWPLWKKEFQISYLRLWEHPLLTWLTCTVIGFSLALPFGLYLLITQLMAFTSSWQAENQMTLYLHPYVEEQEAQALALQLNRMPSIKQVSLVSKQQGLQSFIEGAGLGQAIEHLEQNPLPHVLVVMPQSMKQEVLAPLQRRLQALSAVESAHLDLEWLQKLNAILELGSRIVLALGMGFSFAVLLVVYNTVRLALEHRIREIDTMEQLGASNLFIARPYLLSGACLGFIGGVLALLLVQGVYYWLQYSIGQLAAFYPNATTVTSNAFQVGVSWQACIQLMAFAMLLGFMSAAAAVWAELRKRSL